MVLSVHDLSDKSIGDDGFDHRDIGNGWYHWYDIYSRDTYSSNACMVSPKEELFHVFSYGDLRHWLVGLVLTVKTQAAVSHACHATSA